MDPTIVIPAVIPSGPLGTAFEPAALFAAWGAVVLAVLATLTAALGREGQAPRSGVALREGPRAGAACR